MRKLLSAVLALAATAMTASAARAEPSPSGIEVGLRTGYAIPLGDVNAAGPQTVALGTVQVPEVKLTDTVKGGIPVWLDAGYRFLSPNLFVGAFLQYALLSVADHNATNGAGCPTNASCSAHSFTYGVQAHYHFIPDGPFDPWVGIGFGFESISATSTANGRSGDSGVSGVEFAVLQVGGDYKVMPNLGIGPFLAFSVGQFSSESSSDTAGQSTSVDIQQKALHEWLTLGIRGVYDINL